MTRGFDDAERRGRRLFQNAKTGYGYSEETRIDRNRQISLSSAIRAIPLLIAIHRKSERRGGKGEGRSRVPKLR